MKKNRIYIYDWVRLFATILVVIGHSMYTSMNTVYGNIEYVVSNDVNNMYYKISNYINIFATWLCGYHMQLFFMLSGAVMAIKPIGKFDTFCKNKIKRLYIPYYIYGVLFLLPIKYIAGFYKKKNLAPALKGIIEGIEGSHLWFLTSLFWCMIVFVIVIKICNRLKLNSHWMLLIIAGIIQLQYHRLSFDVFGLKHGMGYIFWLALGYVFELERKQSFSLNKRKVLYLLVGVIIMQLLQVKYSLLSSFIAILSGAYLIYLISWLCNEYLERCHKSKIWNLVIRNLFYVYLFHDPLEYIILKIFFNRHLLNTAFGCIVYFLLRIVGVFIVSVLMGEIINISKKIVIKIHTRERLQTE